MGQGRDRGGYRERQGESPLAPEVLQLAWEDEIERKRKQAEAIAFLQHALFGGRCPAHVVLREAAHGGIAERTL
jgi:hypothetical protein